MAGKRTEASFSLKDQLFNRDRVQYLSSLFAASDDSFDASGFVRDTMRGLKQLELKQRIVHIAEQLERRLADDYRVAAKQITSALPPPLDPNNTDDDFGDFIFAPLGQFVVRNGLEKRYLKLSLKTLKAITKRFSMEDAIRPFIGTHPSETLAELDKWTSDTNYHVRRLVSEGTRPLLPWSGRLSIDPRVPLPMLDALHADSTRYVTRSVANHLNDISKSSPKVVLDSLKRWKQAKQQDANELKWMSRHALRTLIKRGDRSALRFLGFRADPKIQVSQFSICPAKVQAGQAVNFSFSLTANRNESLIVDYVIDFVKANGTLAPRVHKIKQLDVERGQTIAISKRHVLKADATTYTLYPGTHHLTLQINGKSFGRQSFQLRLS
tara:strand:- start:275470 stop:276615 length:1146 start_codon:yes stop_codon:yes gene_type:complete